MLKRGQSETDINNVRERDETRREEQYLFLFCRLMFPRLHFSAFLRSEEKRKFLREEKRRTDQSQVGEEQRGTRETNFANRRVYTIAKMETDCRFIMGVHSLLETHALVWKRRRLLLLLFRGEKKQETRWSELDLCEEKTQERSAKAKRSQANK
jgi:hypothetical protein